MSSEPILANQLERNVSMSNSGIKWTFKWNVPGMDYGAPKGDATAKNSWQRSMSTGSAPPKAQLCNTGTCCRSRWTRPSKRLMHAFEGGRLAMPRFHQTYEVKSFHNGGLLKVFWCEPGPDYGKPVVKGEGKKKRLCQRTATKDFVRTEAAQEYVDLLQRQVDQLFARANDENGAEAVAVTAPEQKTMSFS